MDRNKDGEELQRAGVSALQGSEGPPTDLSVSHPSSTSSSWRHTHSSRGQWRWCFPEPGVNKGGHLHPPTVGESPLVLRIPGHVPSAAQPPGPAVWSSFLGTAHSPPGSSGTGVGSAPSPPSTVHGDISTALIGPEALGGKGWMGMWEKGRQAWRGSEVNSLFLQEQV